MANEIHLPPNTRVMYKDFGTDAVDGFVTTLGTGYLIGINARLSKDEQQKALAHEVYHIECGHLDRFDMTVGQIEMETHCDLFSIGERK